MSVAPVPVERVVLVSRDLPLLEGGNAAVLLAGLDLPPGIEVVERLGGAPAALDALLGAPGATLVIGSDVRDGAGAAAAMTGTRGGTATPLARLHRSLPLRVRTDDGEVHEDRDPRLARERGVRASLQGAGLPGKPAALPGLHQREAAPFCEGDPPDLPTVGASAALFALAALAERRASGLVAAVEQATVVAAGWEPTGTAVGREEPPARDLPARRSTPGAPMRIALTAYDRAFDAKVRWQAGRCPACGSLSFPPRYRCAACGSEEVCALEPLPRTGSVYTATTVHLEVPGLASPYSLALVDLDGVALRALVHVTDTPPGTVDVGDRGRLVLRRVATRNGVPDYGYAFSPEQVG
ncbi:MAG TPA: Zn-ribbon domain-containing OB-fold protein [Acidimicrobiales bacterium]|nr:Zn-ribbon domain-containing OB-fold protein [Acidimicrobiales bacterium]